MSSFKLSIPLFSILVDSSLKVAFLIFQVRNYLPSISAAVGSNAPEIYIFRVCIGLHSFPRFAIAFVYYHFYNDAITTLSIKSCYPKIVTLNCFFNLLEISGLILLTDISSTEDYGIFFGFGLVFSDILEKNSFILILLLREPGKIAK